MLGASGSGFGFTGGASIEAFPGSTSRIVMCLAQQQAFLFDD